MKVIYHFLGQSWAKVQAAIYRVPLIGGLAYCTGADHWKATQEFLVLLGFGTAAFWISGALVYYSPDFAAQEYSSALRTTFANGELFIFSVSVLGPAFYLSISDPEWARRAFPEKAIYAVAVIVLGFTCVAMFSAIRIGGTERLRISDLVDLSVWLTVGALSLRYLAMVVHASRLNPLEEQRRTTKAFAVAVEEHRKEIQ